MFAGPGQLNYHYNRVHGTEEQGNDGEEQGVPKKRRRSRRAKPINADLEDEDGDEQGQDR